MTIPEKLREEAREKRQLALAAEADGNVKMAETYYELARSAEELAEELERQG